MAGYPIAAFSQPARHMTFLVWQVAAAQTEDSIVGDGGMAAEAAAQEQQAKAAVHAATAAGAEAFAAAQV